MSSDGNLSGAAVNPIATLGVAMKWKEWQRYWCLQDQLFLDGKKFN